MKLKKIQAEGMKLSCGSAKILLGIYFFLSNRSFFFLFQFSHFKVVFEVRCAKVGCQLACFSLGFCFLLRTSNGDEGNVTNDNNNYDDEKYRADQQNMPLHCKKNLLMSHNFSFRSSLNIKNLYR